MSFFTRCMYRGLFLGIALATFLQPAVGQATDRPVRKPAGFSVEQGEGGLTGIAREEVFTRDDAYPELGVTIGFPTFLNLEAGYWLGSVGLRLSGMYWGNSYGVQGNLGYKLSETRRRYHAVALVFGRGVGDDPEQECCDWTYAGGAYNLAYRGFFLEVGLETPVKVRRGNFRKVLPLFQIGYMHRFLVE